MFGAKYQAWTKSKKGNPNVLLFSGACFIIAGVIAYNGLYKPWAKKRKLSEHEALAMIIYENEIKQR